MNLLRYFRHWATYSPGTAALWQVPPGEALNRRFVLRRLDDIDEAVRLWVELTERGDEHGARFATWTDGMRLLPGVTPRPHPHALSNGIPAGLVDAAFAATRLVGPNPILIRRVTTGQPGIGLDLAALQAKSSFGDAALQAGILAAGGAPETVAQAVAGRRLYVADLTRLADLREGAWKGTPKFFQPCIGFYWSRPGFGLRPVGIQLGATVGASIVTPGAAGWPEARAWLGNADCIHHEMWTHLGRAHLLMEQFVVTTRAELDRRHPVRRLLEPHFDGVILNMALGRLLLTAPGGMSDQILSPVLSNAGPAGTRGQLQLAAESVNNDWVYDDLFPDREVARRGCEDAAALPDYGYRDDALALFPVMRDYYGAVIQGIYGAGALDSEVLDWVAALRALHPVPLAALSVGDAASLADLVTAIAFHSSAFHAAVNYPQWDWTMVPSDLPGGIYAPPGSGIDALVPGVEAHIRQSEVMHLLAGRRFDTLERTPTLAGFAAERAAYGAALQALEATLIAKVRPFPYPFLQPGLVPLAGNV